MRRRMMTSIVGGAKWKNPYITDGLIAMWDGEWNAGGGVHDSNATVWKDLSGNGFDISVASNLTWSDNALVLNENESVSTILPEVNRPEFTASIVFKTTITQRTPLWIANPSWVGGVLIRYSISHYYPWNNIIYGIDNYVDVSLTLAYANHDQRLYVNGELVGSNATTIDSRNILSRLCIGEYNGNYRRGVLTSYNTKLYDRSMTVAEIAHNYAIDKERFGLA